MTKLELTDERAAIIKASAEEWLTVGRSTAPGDFETAEAAITRLYAAISLPAPRFARFHSPLGAELFLNLVNKTWPKTIGANLGANLWDNLEANLWDNLGANLGANLWANLGANIGVNYEQSWWWGQHEAYWVGHYAFMREIGITYTKSDDRLLRLHEEVCRSCGWFWPYENICIISDRQTAVNKDDRGRLHNPGGPALAFRDGYSLYYIHGVAMSSDVIECPECLTVERIEAERNAEVRRVMLELFGVARYIEENGLSPVSSDEFGSLYRKPQNGDEDLVLVKVVNSTPESDGTYKDYWLRVPPTMRTAREAVAWTFEETPEAYAPLAQS